MANPKDDYAKTVKIPEDVKNESIQIKYSIHQKTYDWVTTYRGCEPILTGNGGATSFSLTVEHDNPGPLAFQTYDGIN